MKIRVTSPVTCVRLIVDGKPMFIVDRDGVVEVPDSVRPQVARLLGRVLEEVKTPPPPPPVEETTSVDVAEAEKREEDSSPPPTVTSKGRRRKGR